MSSFILLTSYGDTGCQVNGRGVGLAFHHTAHILHGKLNYFLTYDTSLIRDQRHALMIRDETINVLRMAVDSNQD